MAHTEDMSIEDRIAFIACLPSNLQNGKLKRGSYKIAAALVHRHRHTVKRVRDRRNEAGDHAVVVYNKKKGASGRCQQQTDDELMQQVEKFVPMAKIGSFHAVATASKIPKSTLVRLFKRGGLRRYNSWVKHKLTDAT